MSSLEISNEKLEEIFKKMDVSNDDNLDYTEFLAAAVSSQSNMVDNNSLKAAFGALDYDHDGMITKADLREALDCDLSDEAIARYLRHADEDGKVSFQNFKRSMMEEMSGDNGKHTEEVLCKLCRSSTGTVRPHRSSSAP